jgi:NAD(P)-dependent dehydrogenase (short-subunit alcohol dehydrogenase family)
VYNPIASVTEAEFDALFNVHLKGPFFLTQALLPLITDGGQIVNMASATSRVATPGVAPYASFKGGLEVLTRYMAKEFGERRIRANAIAPGAIRTELGGGNDHRDWNRRRRFPGRGSGGDPADPIAEAHAPAPTPRTPTFRSKPSSTSPLTGPTRRKPRRGWPACRPTPWPRRWRSSRVTL